MRTIQATSRTYPMSFIWDTQNSQWDAQDEVDTTHPRYRADESDLDMARENAGQVSPMLEDIELTPATYTLKSYAQTGYGTYRVTIADQDGNTYSKTTHEVEAIEAIQAAGRELKYNDDGTYERLRDKLAAAIAAQLELDND